MFKFFGVLSAAIGCLFVISSCQKEYSEAPAGAGGNSSGTAGTNGVFKAKVNGVQYTADAFAAASIMQGVISVTAYSKEKKLFGIAISDTLAGTYTLDQNSFHAMIFTDSTDTNKEPFSTSEGADTTQAVIKVVITIDKVKKVISGTFSGKLYRDSDKKQRLITEGSFQLPYASTIAAAKATDTFRVKIDGTDWAARSISAVVSGGLLTIVASEQNLSKTVSIQLPQAVTAGVYDFDFTGNYVGLYLPDGRTSYIADNGKITVLERNTSSRRIRANFNFNASDFITPSNGAVLTSGYFSVGY